MSAADSSAYITYWSCDRQDYPSDTEVQRLMRIVVHQDAQLERLSNRLIHVERTIESMGKEMDELRQPLMYVETRKDPSPQVPVATILRALLDHAELQVEQTKAAMLVRGGP